MSTNKMFFKSVIPIYVFLSKHAPCSVCNLNSIITVYRYDNYIVPYQARVQSKLPEMQRANSTAHRPTREEAFALIIWNQVSQN